VYKLHPLTVQRWRKNGLKAIDEANKPLLFLGEEIRRFLKEMLQKRHYPLNPGEFFCTKCRAIRKSLPNQLSFEITEKGLGKTYKQAFVRGICLICGQPLLLFSSDRRIQELKKLGLLLVEHEKSLSGSGGSSLDTDILRGEKCLNQTSKTNE